MTVLRVCYRQGVPFDEKYYFDTHIPMAGPIMGSLGVKKSEVFSAYFDSAAALQQCMQDPRMGQVLGDVPNYFTGETDVMVGETVG